MQDLRPGVVAVLCLIIGGAIDGARADDKAAAEEQPALWEGRLAAFARYGASYPASDENQVDVVPLPLPIYRGRFWRLGEDRRNPIRGRLLRTDRVKLDLAFDLNFPVDSGDIDARTGMPDLDLLLEIGPELEVELATQDMMRGRSFLGLQLKPAFSFDGVSPTYEGLIFSPEYTYLIRSQDDVNEYKVRVTPAFATSKYMDFYYEVTPQFATPTRPVYSGDGGYLGTDLTFTFSHNFSDNLDFVIGSRISFFQGAANDDSPLFIDKTNYSVYGAFTWKFWESERRASDKDDSWP